jgi:hypothetical protein
MSSQSAANEPQALDFSALPLDKNGPHGNAWGRWEPDDQLGTLNFLTDDLVARAVSECVKTGQRTSLKYVFVVYMHPGGLTECCSWTLEGPTYPRFQRKTLSLKTINKAPLKHAHDDEVSRPLLGGVASRFIDHHLVL